MNEATSNLPLVYAAISEVMTTLAKDGISKDRTSTQGYKFRGIDDVYSALAPAMIAAGLVVIPNCLERACVERETQKGGALFYVTVKASYMLVCVKDGSSVTAGPFFGEAMDSSDKATNKAMSAAYKYWAFQTFCIPTDAENDIETQSVALKPSRPNTATQVAKDALDAMGDEEKDFLRTHAEAIKKLFPLGDMLGYIEEQRFDTEEKLALWSILPSQVRSAIKAQQNAEAKERAAKQVTGVPA